MYSMNQPPKRPSRWRRLVAVGYGLAAAVAVLMALVGAFAMNSALLSVISIAYAMALVGAVLYKMAKERAGEDLYLVRTVLYALLLCAAAFDGIITFVMPSETLAGRIVPVLLVIPCAAISAFQIWKNGRYLR
ncbi:MAG: hypothetical protein Q4E13_10055 [Clostridia bacterium]|nr:hypothetical protein [Clostridia bacterium]